MCEVTTDKLAAPIPSTHDGVVKAIKFKVDDICLVGHTLLEIEVGENNAKETAKPIYEAPAKATLGETKKEEIKPSPATTSVSQVHKVETAPPGNKALATPAVRFLAKKHSLDINAILGTGKGGRVTKEDVLNYISKVS